MEEIPGAVLLSLASHTIVFFTRYYFSYGNCADNLDFSSAACVDVKICVNDGTTFAGIVANRFPSANIVPKQSGEFVAEGLKNGDCNWSFRDVVEAVGSFGDIYERNVEAEVPRGGLNLVNTGDHAAPLRLAGPTGCCVGQQTIVSIL